MKMPVVAIVGRPNVGKSSLLNALARKRISIVQDMPGVTRDRVSFPLPVEAVAGRPQDIRYIELMDTGGYGFDDAQGLTEHIRHQIDIAMNRADLVLFIVDCADSLVSTDRTIADMLRELGKKVVIVANKADAAKADFALGEFARLGFGTPIGVSALTGRNIEAVFDAIRDNVDLSGAPTSIAEPEMLVAIVGKRNAGKSTLVNAIAKNYEGDADRVIVSEVPGTTRDSVDVRFEKDGKALIVIDTAGVRKKRHMVTSDIEYYSFHRAQRSIRRADVVMMLIDATEPLSEPDKKLAQYIAEQEKPVLFVINKWDVARDLLREQGGRQRQKFSDSDAMEEYRTYIDLTLRHLTFAPLAFVTAKEGKNVQQALDLAQNLFKQSKERVTTGRLNRAIKMILEERMPPSKRGRRIKIYYATQIDVSPPTIAVIVNHPEDVTDEYQRFVVNRLRDLLPFEDVPIRLVFRPRGEGSGARSLEQVEDVDEQLQELKVAGARKSASGSKAPTVDKPRVPKPPKTRAKLRGRPAAGLKGGPRAFQRKPRRGAGRSGATRVPKQSKRPR